MIEVAGSAWRQLRDRTNAYLANGDPLASGANAGAFIVWGNQPFYPLYVWLLVGNDAWPSLVTWLSTPVFVCVPLIARKNSVAGRSLFVMTGVANTLLSVKAFGTDTSVAWFLVPCAILCVGFFRWREWIGVALLLMTLAASFVARDLGAPLHAYDEVKSRSLAHLNLWSVSVLSLYLVYAAIKARVAMRSEPNAR